MASNSPSLFGDPSIDHAVAGLGAGTVATLVMHPLDLVKVRFQLADSPSQQQPVASSSKLPSLPSSSTSISSHQSFPLKQPGTKIPKLSSSSMFKSTTTTTATMIRENPITAVNQSLNPNPNLNLNLNLTKKKPGFGRAVYGALEDAVKIDGWKGLYRGLIPNLVGGAGSWGLYFLFYNMIKKQMQGGDPNYRTSGSQHLLAAAEASALTAMMTNPIWVVKTRVFATPRTDPSAYRGLWDGLTSIYRTEGLRGLYKGSLLALVGVSNGSIQFATYEEIKRRRTDIKRRLFEKQGRGWRTEDEKLSNTEYILASGSSKLVAIALTYPYQVVRARIQNAPAPLPDRPRLNIPQTISQIYAREGFLAFYKGLGTNALRILPGTCTTFVVYENLVWGFRRLAGKREKERLSQGRKLV